MLAQANSKEGPDWKAWENPPGENNRGILALKADLAAARQEEDKLSDFRINLLKARHEDRKDLTDIDVILDAARAAGLDTGRLREDMEDPALLQVIAESHIEGSEKFGAFGVPTFVFPNGEAAFLKMFKPTPEESVELYDTLTKVMGQWHNIGELKRPQPPWPAVVKPS